MTNFATLAAQLAVSAASIAASVFLPPPFGILISTAIGLTGNLAIQGATGDWSLESTLMSVLGAGVSVAKSTGAFKSLAKTVGDAIGKASPKLALQINKFSINLKRIGDSINAKLNQIAPDQVIEKALKKWNGNASNTQLQDAQTIMQKTAELETFGEVRTDKKINSTKFNPNSLSWIKCATFEETKFINRNNIIGNLTIIYYLNNGSRLGLRKNSKLNGNNNVIAITVPNARYKNEYVSGICKAKSWGRYYMRTWMIGKPGRGPGGINTAIFFGNSWRVDKKLKNLLSSYKNIDSYLMNYSGKVAKKFLGKTQIGTKLMSYKDVYTKATSATTQVKNGRLNFMKPYLKKLKAKGTW